MIKQFSTFESEALINKPIAGAFIGVRFYGNLAEIALLSAPKED
jgi:hypothetical protein